MINRLGKLILHPFLFAAYPMLYLLTSNLQQLKFYSGLRALVICLAFSVLLFFFFQLITKNAQRAALITSFSFILFFAYGPIHSLIPADRVFGLLLSKQRYMLILWGVLFVAMIWLVGWKLRNPASLNLFMNFSGTLLLGILLIQAIIFTARPVYMQTQGLNVQDISGSLKPPPMDRQPDVYYIILDAYPSSAVLKDEYKIDNSDFIKELEQRGFYVAKCTQSNYPMTAYSLASSLNMDYIPPVGKQFLTIQEPFFYFASYFRSNSVRNALVDLGYKTVTFDTYSSWLNITNSDHFISPRDNQEMVRILNLDILNIFIGKTNNYEQKLIQMTPLVNIDTLLYSLHIVPDNTPIGFLIDEPQNRGENKIHYDVFKYDLEQLGSVASLPGKKFVFAHFLTTHKPFLFTQDGAFNPDQGRDGYINSLRYTDGLILEAIDQIIAQSNPKPVIIIQGDHALAGSDDPFGILNAYYLPGIGASTLYPSISPVNSFRIVFDKYFGGNFPLLPDLSYRVDSINSIPLTDPVENIPNCP